MDALAPARSHQSLDGRSGCGKTLSETTSKLRELLKGGLSRAMRNRIEAASFFKIIFFAYPHFQVNFTLRLCFLDIICPQPLGGVFVPLQEGPKASRSVYSLGSFGPGSEGLADDTAQTGLFFSAEAKTEGHVNPRIVRPWRYMYLYASSAFVWILAPLSE